MDATPERRKIRVRVARGSRLWRWKVAAVALAFILLLLCCFTFVPRWLGAVASDAGAPAEAPAEAPPHP